MELLLRMMPDNQAALRLHKAIQRKQKDVKKRDERIGMATTALAVGVGILAAAVLGGRKKR